MRKNFLIACALICAARSAAAAGVTGGQTEISALFGQGRHNYGVGESGERLHPDTGMPADCGAQIMYSLGSVFALGAEGLTGRSDGTDRYDYRGKFGSVSALARITLFPRRFLRPHGFMGIGYGEFTLSANGSSPASGSVLINTNTVTVRGPVITYGFGLTMDITGGIFIGADLQGRYLRLKGGDTRKFTGMQQGTMQYLAGQINEEKIALLRLGAKFGGKNK